MSDTTPRDASEEEREFFSLFSLVKEDFHPILDDFASRMVRYVKHHHDDFRTESPDVGEILSSGLVTAVKSFMSIWKDDEEEERSSGKDTEE